MRGGRENLRFPADTALAERDGLCPLVSTSKTLATVKEASLLGWVNLNFVLLGFQTCTAVARSPLR